MQQPGHCKFQSSSLCRSHTSRRRRGNAVALWCVESHVQASRNPATGAGLGARGRLLESFRAPGNKCRGASCFAPFSRVFSKRTNRAVFYVRFPGVFFKTELCGWLMGCGCSCSPGALVIFFTSPAEAIRSRCGRVYRFTKTNLIHSFVKWQKKKR